jgi:hypothetical protein
MCGAGNPSGYVKHGTLFIGAIRTQDLVAYADERQGACIDGVSP